MRYVIFFFLLMSVLAFSGCETSCEEGCGETPQAQLPYDPADEASIEVYLTSTYGTELDASEVLNNELPKIYLHHYGRPLDAQLDPKVVLNSAIGDAAQKAFFHSLTPLINAISRIQILGKEAYIHNTWINATDTNLMTHEGRHPMNNTRYKEWWYFDAHADSGYVVSCALVLSIVDPHYFIWVYDPVSGQVLTEVMKDGPVTVNDFGVNGVNLVADKVQFDGRADTGYTFAFQGDTMDGVLSYTNPIPGRGEHHDGIDKTFYGLYQVPVMTVNGTLTVKATGQTIAFNGKGYHDHWWGIQSRYTKWSWMQVKYNNGWVSGMYEGKYGFYENDLHRYSWIYTPENGYQYFDNNTFSFTELEEKNRWRGTVSGNGRTLDINTLKRVERYEFKPVVLYGVTLGVVDYYQYPITASASFTDASGTTDLTSELGMLEWDWDAIW